MQDKQVKLNLREWLFNHESFTDNPAIDSHYIINSWNRINNITLSNFEKSRSFFNKYNVLNLSGLYSYFFNDRCIYIGKSKNIRKRLLDHLNEAFYEERGILLNKGRRGHRWYKFFSKYKTFDLDIYWIQVEDCLELELLEKYLIERIQPEFENNK